jgi:hypothetical protein
MAVADGQWQRLKACPDCRWVFYDHTRNASKRWCLMHAGGPDGRACGTIAKLRQYRQKQKASAHPAIASQPITGSGKDRNRRLGLWRTLTQASPVARESMITSRIYDYLLGGKDNFAADREAAEQAIAANPGIVTDVRANRAFLARVVRFLASECGGVRQFLDIGTGLSTASNTHEVAQAVIPSARVVYVDNDHSKSGCAYVRESR